MKKNKIGITISLLLITSLFFYNKKETTLSNIDNQDYPIWKEMMEQPNVNIKEARDAFDTYWKHHSHYKGDRSKQFERWYEINSRRLNKYGNVISAEQVKLEYLKLKSVGKFQQKGKWFNYGPINVGPRNNVKKDGGRVKSIDFHPTDQNTFLVSCFKGGLFKTTNAGLTWTPLTDQLPQEVYVSKMLPSNPNTIFIGTNSGVFKSTDGGSNWNTTSLPSIKTNALLINSTQENIIIAGTQNGIYRSVNGGNTWTLVQSTNRVEEIKTHPTNANILYAGTNGTTSKFFRSSDAGLTWTQNNTFGTGAFIKIAVTPAQPDYVYVINSRDHLSQDSFEGVYLSTNSGQSFNKQSGETPCITGYNDDGSKSRGQPNYNLFIVADPNNANTIYAGGVKSWKSTNAGVSWTQIYRNVTADNGDLHLDQLSWAFSPLNDKLYAVNDGGIYFYNDDNKFETITDGLPIAEIWECTQSQQNPTNVAGGTFHCGIKLNKNGEWLSPWGGDEATVLFDYSNDNYAYHFKYEKISRSVDGGLSFQRINSSSADRGWYTGTGVLDKSDANTLFVGLHEVERINNARTATSSQTWDKISSFGGSSRIEKIEQSDANHNILYVSREGNSFYRSDNVRDVSPTFTNITANLPISGKVTDIATHPTNDAIVYILLGSKIYKSQNKGVSWTDISNGLPSVALLEMIYDKSSNEGIYIGTDMGIYYKDASLSSWIDYSAGLPTIRVSGMDIYYGASRQESFITVSTDGRGFWRSTLNEITATNPTVNFTSNKTEVFTEGQVQFTNQSSTVHVGSYNWTFEGGTPASSIEKNPKVTYNTQGTFNVTLSYTTDSGVETKLKSNYITVSKNVSIDGLEAHYQFSNNLNDISENDRNLTKIGTNVSYSTDKEGNTTSVFNADDATGEYLQTSDYKGISGNGARTVAAWVKLRSGGNKRTIVSWGENANGKMFNVMIKSGKVRVEGGNCNITGTKVIPNNTWHHVAVTFDPTDDGGKISSVKIYVDGALTAEESNYNGTIILNTDTTTNNLRIGEAIYDTTHFYRGELDDVCIYSKALSATEIKKVATNIYTAASGNWSTGANWTYGAAPLATESAYIPSGKIVTIGASTGAVTNNLTVDAAGSLTITSGGSLIVSGTSSGNVTYNRSIDFVAGGNLKGWFLMASPVNGQDYDDAYATTNGLATSGNKRGLATYTTGSDSWSYLLDDDSNSGTFTNGIGYSLKKQSTTGNVGFTGTINTDNTGIDVVLATTGNRFNALGNPYTSYISSATFLNNEASISETKTLWVWNQTLGTNGSYEVKDVDDALIIAPGQGFLIKANTGGGTFNFSEANQTHNTDTFQKENSNPIVKLWITDGTIKNYSRIKYLDNATTGFDIGYEGELFSGSSNSFAVYSHLVSDSQGKNYQLQSLPNSNHENMVIPIGINAAKGKEITFTAEALNLPSGIKVFLEDRHTNTFTRLDKANAEYKVTLTDTANGIGQFYLHTKSSVLNTKNLNLNNISIYKLNSETLRIVGLNQEKTNVKLFNILGKQVLSSSFASKGVKDIKLPKLATGIYIVQLQTEKGKLNKKITIE